MFTVAATFSDSIAPQPGMVNDVASSAAHLLARQAARFVAEHVAVERSGTRGLQTARPRMIQAGDAREAAAQRIQRHVELDGHMKDGAHAGAHDFAVVQIDAVGAEQAAEISEPGQRAQDRAEIARVLDLVQIDRRARPSRGAAAGSSGTTAAMPCGERVSLICAICLDC